MLLCGYYTGENRSLLRNVTYKRQLCIISIIIVTIIISSSSVKSQRGCRMRAAMLVITSLLAGVYLALLRHTRQRTVLRPASRDCDVTDEMPTLISGDWQSRGPDVDNDFSLTNVNADSSTGTLFSQA